MTTPDLTRTPVLTGALVELRPTTPADVARLHTLMNDGEVARLTGSVHSDDAADEQEWTVEQLQEIYARWATDDDRQVWSIVQRSTGEVVGESVLNLYEPENRSISFRIWISGARDRGLGTEATRLTVDHAFAGLGVHRVELEVYAFNPRARRVYEKVGFQLEGTRRESFRYADGWVDCHLMAILEQDWRAAAAAASSPPASSHRK